VHPVTALDDLPPDVAVRFDDSGDRGLVGVGDLRERGCGLGRQTEELGEQTHAVEHAPERWIGDAGGEAVLG
jgi:hypothetical protein